VRRAKVVSNLVGECELGHLGRHPRVIVHEGDDAWPRKNDKIQNDVKLPVLRIQIRDTVLFLPLSGMQKVRIRDPGWKTRIRDK
jgi:hypothetical protein